MFGRVFGILLIRCALCLEFTFSKSLFLGGFLFCRFFVLLFVTATFFEVVLKKK